VYVKEGSRTMFCVGLSTTTHNFPPVVSENYSSPGLPRGLGGTDEAALSWSFGMLMVIARWRIEDRRRDDNRRSLGYW
jgi:hypothetical protein